jgi:hypothetical protein
MGAHRNLQFFEQTTRERLWPDNRDDDQAESDARSAALWDRLNKLPPDERIAVICEAMDLTARYGNSEFFDELLRLTAMTRTRFYCAFQRGRRRLTGKAA